MKFKFSFFGIRKKKRPRRRDSAHLTLTHSGDDKNDVDIEEEPPADDDVNVGVNLAEAEITPEYAFKHPTLYFDDGVRKIDFIVVYEETEGQKVNSGHERFRRRFFKNLKQAGVEIEDAEDIVEKITRTYYKIHIPWAVLSEHAEELCCRAKLDMSPNPSHNWSESVIGICHIPNIMKPDLPYVPQGYVTTPYSENKLKKFIGHTKKETFFSGADRSRVAYHIMANLPYGSKKRGEIGIDRLVNEGIFCAAYPLHDGPHHNKYEKEIDLNSDKAPPEDYYNARYILKQYWGRFGMWYKYQPLENIRLYYGEKVGVYFAWLGFYTCWLLPLALVGLVVFIYSIATMHSNVVIPQVCEDGKKILMCPRCDIKAGCNYWNLSTACTGTKITYIVDNPSTVFFSVFTCFWAVFFLEFWKRKEVTLSYHWDTMDFEEEEERPRAAFAAFAPSKRKNPITGEWEPYLPPLARIPRYITGVSVMIIMAVMVVILLVGVLLYRAVVSGLLHAFKGGSMIISVSATIINLILIMVLSTIYTKLAMKLTDWELHRTQTEHEDQLTFKVFCFQFVNFYGSIFYIAFFKGRFDGYPGHYNRIFGVRLSTCGPAGCLLELAQQLAIIMIGKQIIGNAKELFIPWLKNYLAKRKAKKALAKKAANADGDRKDRSRSSVAKRHASESKPLIKQKDDQKQLPITPRWVKDFTLQPDEPLFGEYLEMIIQYGFTTIFVVAFPIAPLFALLNNWIEIRLDAHIYITQSRRPVAHKAQDIGVWFTILNVVTRVAVVCNAFLIAFTSQFIPKVLYAYEYDPTLKGFINHTLAWAPEGTTSKPCRYRSYRDENGQLTFFYWKLTAIRLAFVVVFEHVVFAISVLIDIMVPDVPKSLELKIKREQFVAKKALEERELVSDAAASKPAPSTTKVTKRSATIPKSGSADAAPSHVKVAIDSKGATKSSRTTDKRQ